MKKIKIIVEIYFPLAVHRYSYVHSNVVEVKMRYVKEKLNEEALAFRDSLANLDVVNILLEDGTYLIMSKDLLQMAMFHMSYTEVNQD